MSREDSDLSDTQASRQPLPPSPPPLPAPPAAKTSTLQHRTRVSPFIGKLRAAPQNYWFESGEPAVEVDTIRPTGWYFFYGTLSDPSFLSEVLGLDENPKLQPAKVVSYTLRLWGQYPALMDGEWNDEICGMAWQVTEKNHSVRLVEYETRAYRVAPCKIMLLDRKGDKGTEVGDEFVYGYTFKYCGNPQDLSEGSFDLQKWLKIMGRTKV